MATAMGLSRLDSHTGQWQNYTKAQGLTTNYITCVAATDTEIWVGTAEGLGRYQKNRWKFWGQKNGLCGDFVLSIAVVDEMIWVGTRGGLSRYDQ